MSGCCVALDTIKHPLNCNIKNKQPLIVAVEGPIGAGKSSVCSYLYWEMKRLNYNIEWVQERVQDNQFFKEFDKEESTKEFHTKLLTQLSFLDQRVEDMNRAIHDRKNHIVLLDRCFIGDFILAAVNLKTSPKHWNLYKNLYNQLTNSLPRPDVIFDIKRPSQEIIPSLKTREETLTDQYLFDVVYYYTVYRNFLVENTISYKVVENDSSHYNGCLDKYFYNLCNDWLVPHITNRIYNEEKISFSIPTYKQLV